MVPTSDELHLIIIIIIIDAALQYIYTFTQGEIVAEIRLWHILTGKEHLSRSTYSLDSRLL